MSVEGLLMGVVLVGVVVLWIGTPFLRRKRTAQVNNDVVERQRERLTLYYGRVLRNIHDLDEDFGTGKLDEREYQFQRELWAQRGVAVLQRLDELDAVHLVAEADADDASIDAAIDDQIELAVSAYRKVQNEV